MCCKCINTQFTQVFILTDLLSYSVFMFLSFLRCNHSFESKKNRVICLFISNQLMILFSLQCLDYCILIKRRKNNS